VKPSWLSTEDYEGFLAVARRVFAAGLAGRFLRPDAYGLDLLAAGEWLGGELARRGETPARVNDVCQAFGQACVGWREPWATAQALLKRWGDGRAPTAGPAWAEELLTGDVSDLPPGGLRIVRARRPS
jgi:hypothetical protein